MPVEPAGLIFDCDGVLVDSEVIAVEVEARLLTEMGLATTPADVVRRWVGRSAADQLADLTAELGADKAREFERRAADEVTLEFRRSLTSVRGIGEVLDALDTAKVPFCVASSGTPGRIATTLGITGLLPRFQSRVFSATEVAHGKPAPDLFLHAARSMGVEPSRCVVVEDSTYGVLAGRAAGMRVIGYAGGLSDATSLADAGAEVVHDMSDLMGLLAHSRSSTA